MNEITLAAGLEVDNDVLSRYVDLTVKNTENLTEAIKEIMYNSKLSKQEKGYCMFIMGYLTSLADLYTASKENAKNTFLGHE